MTKKLATMFFCSTDGAIMAFRLSLLINSCVSGVMEANRSSQCLLLWCQSRYACSCYTILPLLF
ncbi:hypothetical protein Hdeb2414_s0002g00068081 [Helianthus debilis subsp. tardiflorus]